MNDMTETPTQRRIQATAFTPTSAADAATKFSVNPLYVATGALFLVAMVAIWFLVSARSLVVTPNPTDALVSIKGGFSFRIGGNYLMLPGEYQLQATHPEFEPLQESFVLGDAEVQTLSPQLTPLPGQLLITTAPAESTFSLYLDDKPAEIKDNIVSDIPAGSHQYVVITERYQDAQGSIDIVGRKQQQTLLVELQPAWADVTLDSLPANANILLDGKIIGQTPATVEIIAGEKELVIQKDGYKSKPYPLTVVAQEKQDLGQIMLEKIDAQLRITSKPSEAGVTVNGQYLGQTPLQAAVTPGQDITVSIFKGGYQSVQKNIALTSGQSQSLELDLAAVLGEVSIKATPEDATLYIDGRAIGKANQIIKLPAKQHQVTVVRDGYAPFKTSVLPRPGLTLSLAPTLKTEAQARWEKIKPTITASATGQALKLFRPDVTFQMGSSRREQGRRSNEAQRKITLNRAFYLATSETTNGEYRRFKREHSSSHASGNSLDNDENPVVNVSWQDAALFCNWLSQQENLPPFYQEENGKVTGFNPAATGYRLPTEAEWAWVSRYHKGTMLKYTWGPSLPPAPGSENIGDRSAASLLGTIQASYDDKYIVTAPVNQFKPNHNGLYDINGNVSEWISDYYMIKTGLSQTPEVDPLGPLQGDYHVIRGASWKHGGISDLRLSFRDYGAEGKNYIGFRIARYVE